MSLSSCQVMESMTSELSDLLAGRSGVLSQWYQRHCIFLAYEELRRGIISTPMSGSRAAELASRAVDGLMSAVEKESHDDTRAVGLGCLIRWTAALASLPPALLQFLKKGLASTARPLATISAAAICQLSGCSAFRGQLSSLLSGLMTRLDFGAKKTTVFHPDAIYSAKAVLELADNVDQSFPWHALESEDSFIFPASVLGQQSADMPTSLGSVGEAAGPLLPHVCEVVCKVVVLSIKHIRNGLLSDACASALMRCALHSLKGVRQTAITAALEVTGAITDARAALLKALLKVRPSPMIISFCGDHYTFNMKHEAPRVDQLPLSFNALCVTIHVQIVRTTALAEAARSHMSMTCLPSSTKDDRKFGLPPPPPNRFAAALSCILSSSTPHYTGGILADTLILAHHPIVCHSAKGAASLWGGIQTRAFGGARRIDHILADEVCATDVATCLVRTMHSDLGHDRCVLIYQSCSCV